MTHLVGLTAREESELRRVAREYDYIDRPQRLCRHIGGRVNATYVVEAREQTFVLRRSAPSADPAHLGLEIEVLLYLEKTGYRISPRVLQNRQGDYVRECPERC